MQSSQLHSHLFSWCTAMKRSKDKKICWINKCRVGSSFQAIFFKYFYTNFWVLLNLFLVLLACNSSSCPPQVSHLYLTELRPYSHGQSLLLSPCAGDFSSAQHLYEVTEGDVGVCPLLPAENTQRSAGTGASEQQRPDKQLPPAVKPTHRHVYVPDDPPQSPGDSLPPLLLRSSSSRMRGVQVCLMLCSSRRLAVSRPDFNNMDMQYQFTAKVSIKRDQPFQWDETWNDVYFVLSTTCLKKN